jgi:uncharacterized Zn finger protein (UPF0148 family)
MNKHCTDCGRIFRDATKKKTKLICAICEEKLDLDGVKEVKQPSDAREYTPRYNGMRVFKDDL